MSDAEPRNAGERFGEVWEHVRHLEDRIGELEKWRASVDAVSSWRRLALPLIFSAAGLLLATVDLILKYR